DRPRHGEERCSHRFLPDRCAVAHTNDDVMRQEQKVSNVVPAAKLPWTERRTLALARDACTAAKKWVATPEQPISGQIATTLNGSPCPLVLGKSRRNIASLR